MKSQLPSVGSIVHYRPMFPPDSPAFGLPFAAIVTYAWEAEAAGFFNLAVFDPDGGLHQSLQVPFFDGVGMAPTANYCEWPKDSRPRIQLVS